VLNALNKEIFKIKSPTKRYKIANIENINLLDENGF